MDIVSILNEQPDYIKSHNYWRWLKRKLKSENNELVSTTHSFKFIAPDGKKRLADTLDSDGIIELAKNFPNTKSVKFLDWFLYSDNTIDEQNQRQRDLYERNRLFVLLRRAVRILKLSIG